MSHSKFDDDFNCLFISVIGRGDPAGLVGREVGLGDGFEDPYSDRRRIQSRLESSTKRKGKILFLQFKHGHID